MERKDFIKWAGLLAGFIPFSLSPRSAYAESDAASDAGSDVTLSDFGAVGDDTADDTQAIQAALDQAAGGTCYFPSGTFKITDRLIPPPNTLIVMHPGTVIRQATKWKMAFDILDRPNVTIDGNGAWIKY